MLVRFNGPITRNIAMIMSIRSATGYSLSQAKRMKEDLEIGAYLSEVQIYAINAAIRNSLQKGDQGRGNCRVHCTDDVYIIRLATHRFTDWAGVEPAN